MNDEISGQDFVFSMKQNMLFKLTEYIFLIYT